MPERIYVDNAATSFPKPPAVSEAMRHYAETLGASAGRGAYREALEVGDMLTDTRYRLARIFNAESHEAIVFTHNGSAALNLAIHGLLRDGDHVVATRLEHNSVLRPLHTLLDEHRIKVTWIAPAPDTGTIAPQDVAAALTPETRLVCINHGSNVTGAVQPIAAISSACRPHRCALLVDAAQTAGHVPIDVRAMQIDLLAVPGHKGLMGPLGTGALYIRPGLESSLRPLMQGGTGSSSELPIQPDFMPDRFEPGSHNAIGIAGLNAALQWMEPITVATLRAHDLELSTLFLNEAAAIDGLTVHGPKEAERRVAVFSVTIAGMEPSELAAVLEAEFGILTRPGIHCAPFAHQFLGTDGLGGTVRLSFGAFNTPADVSRCVAALGEIASQAAAPAPR